VKVIPWRKFVLLLSISILAVFTSACNTQELRVMSTQETVGAERNRVGLTLCADGAEYRNSYGYGKGLSELEVSLVGYQLHVRYQEHTFAGPTTTIRERRQITLP
jgi:hypothetical protein